MSNLDSPITFNDVVERVNESVENNATGTNALAMGPSSTASGYGAVSIGYSADASGAGSIMLGPGSNNVAHTLQFAPDDNNQYVVMDASGKFPIAGYIPMVGADGVNAGSTGSVPQPSATDNTKFLRGDGTWVGLGVVLTYKGSKTSYADLPSSGNEAGDVWNVTDTDKNYAWTGSEWDDFGGTVTFSIAGASDANISTPTAGQVLAYDAASSKWKNTNPVVPDPLPSQTGQSGKFLTTNGTTASWGNALANTATGTDSIAVGDATATGTSCISIGDSTNSTYPTEAPANYSIAIGTNANISSSSTTAIAIGSNDSSSYATRCNGSASIAIGYRAKTNRMGAVSIGSISLAQGRRSTAIGYGAQVSADVNDAIQIGYGSNTTTCTMKVGFYDTANYELLSADGTIPAARLTNAIQGALTSTTVTLAAADWSSNTQTVSVTGMTATKIVWVSPAGSSMSDYADGGVYCSAQGSGTLTFTCSTAPTNDLTVQVVFG